MNIKKNGFFSVVIFIIISHTVYGQLNNCITSFKDNLDELLSPEFIKKYAQSFESDHYIIGTGTDYVESQYFWYPDDETTFYVKLYGLKKEISENPIDKYKKKVQKKSDEVYKYFLAENVGDYAYWTINNLNLESATTTDATLTVLYKKEKFVVQVDVGDYEKSQNIAKEIAAQIISQCK
jgi:hypothetical protein